MKNRILIISFLAIALCSCSKTKELYKEYAYNSPVFDENYYVKRNGVDELPINNETVYDNKQHSIDNTADFEGFTNLSDIDSSFKYGYLSKLYDGRLECEGLYQLSRVQLNKTGYATFFPKQLKQSFTFGISLRGGSTCVTPLYANLKYDIHLSFYIHLSNNDKYDKVTYNISNALIPTDNGSFKVLWFYNMDQINGAVAMSMSFELKEPTRTNLTDDMNDKEKDHVAIMLYEVLIPGSTWL